MRLSPTLHKYATMYNNQHTIIEDNIDMWYDSLNVCISNDMEIDLALYYIEAITDENTE